MRKKIIVNGAKKAELFLLFFRNMRLKFNFFHQALVFSLFFEIFIALRANLCYPIVCEFASTDEARKFRICGP